MKANINFTCDPDFYEGMSYAGRNAWGGDIHVMCGGECPSGALCECWCHAPEGELIYGERRRAREAWQKANAPPD
jgi:hypothetical protein